MNSNGNSSQYKIVLFGQGGSGKAFLIYRLCYDRYSENYDPQLEDEFFKTLDVDGEKIPVVIRRCADQEHEIFYDQYLKWGNGFMLCFSVTNRESFNKVTFYRENILRSRDTDDECIIILVGCKSDDIDKRQVSREEAEELAQQNRWVYVETSSKTNTNVSGAFCAITKAVKHFLAQPREPKQEQRAKRNDKCVLQ